VAALSREAAPAGVRRDTVLFVSIAAGLGGSTRSLVTVLSRLDPGIRRVLATPAEGKLPALVRERGLAALDVPIPKPNDRRLRRASRLVAAARIARWARRHAARLAAIHANGMQEVSLVVPAAVASGVPLVMWIHDFEVYPWTRRLSPVWRRMLRGRDVRWAAVSGTARDVLVESGLAAAGDVEIVANPIDPDDVRAPRRTEPGVVSIAFVGSAERRKGFHLLPDVDRELADLPVRWRLYASSPTEDDPAWARLRALPADRITFHGKVEDIRPAYAGSDVVFCPSRKESFCRVAAEAMLNGIPVVGSDIGPLRELLGREEAGLLFPAEDVPAAGAALRRLVLDPALRKSLGGRGRERARDFEPERVVERLTALYGVEPARAGSP
jgi:glycosyltransferase involved in cell wall biosynthesis